jgi:phenylalanyl-tRNA synthetase beta chain
VKIIPAWLREFVDVAADDHQLAEALTSAGIAVESVQEEHGATIYEMDLTTNRVDAMNHYGVAREASAIYNVTLKKVEPKLPEANGVANFSIVIDDAHGCTRYTARVVRNVKIGPSPEHVVKRLELLGSRSINNAADATNYALNELGHPTHAFDLDLLEGGTIIVRRARAGETLKTLDGVDRSLTTDDLVIADAKKPVALAGVMGGFDSMITERTKSVLIESAWFEPCAVRSMAKRHGMHTDASHRFERGADYGITPLACDRVADLILSSAGGELRGERIDAVVRSMTRPSITLRSSEITRNLGIEIPDAEVERILCSLGFEVSRTSREFTVNVPTWRLDVEREIDVLEELARIYGYNNFPNTLPGFSGAVVELPNEPKNTRVRETMLALGYNEAISITFIAEHEARAFSGGDPLSVANPLSEESAYMRTSLLPGLVGMVSYNLNRGTTNVRLFEAGQIFEKHGDGNHERRHLGFAATGDAIAKSLRSAPQPYSFFHLKGDMEALLGSFEHRSLQFDTAVPAYFHPGRGARAVVDGEAVAYFGQLHPDQAAARKLRQEVYLAEVMLDRLYQHPLHEPRYQRISKFPAVERDFSFVFKGVTTFERIQSAIAELGLTELRTLVPAEIYRGETLGAGKYSLLLHAEFQSQERTLRDDEVAQWSAQIISRLEAIGGTLRAQ